MAHCRDQPGSKVQVRKTVRSRRMTPGRKEGLATRLATGGYESSFTFATFTRMRCFSRSIARKRANSAGELPPEEVKTGRHELRVFQDLRLIQQEAGRALVCQRCPRDRRSTHDRSGSACLNGCTPRDKETTGGLNSCRVVQGDGRRLRRTDRRGWELGAHQGFSF
jgi:hypothetical protein